MEIEKVFKILKSIKEGSQECLNIEMKNNPQNIEDIKHYRDEVSAIEMIINAYNREKSRADKLEYEYSKMLTKLDEYEEE